jgi:hypothetical protein
MTNRFRPQYRELTPAEQKLIDAIKTKAEELEHLYDMVAVDSRYKSLAFTTLEESVMWIVKEVTT